MSRPTSATITSAVRRMTPGIGRSHSTLLAQRGKLDLVRPPAGARRNFFLATSEGLLVATDSPIGWPRIGE